MFNMDEIDAHLADLSPEQQLSLARRVLLYRLDPETTLATLAAIILTDTNKYDQQGRLSVLITA